MSEFTLHEWIQQIETEIAASQVHNHLFGKEIASGTVNGISVEMIEKGRQKLKWLKELQRYKDLEEAGRLIELPCKVGDTVHFITEDGRILDTTLGDLNTVYRFKDLIGKAFYLTKAEAEAKLAEIRGA